MVGTSQPLALCTDKFMLFIYNSLSAYSVTTVWNGFNSISGHREQALAETQPNLYPSPLVSQTVRPEVTSGTHIPGGQSRSSGGLL